MDDEEITMEGDLQVDDTKRSERKRTFTDKGKQYNLDAIKEQFINLRKLTEKTLTLISDHSSDDVIRTNYHLWMEKFEVYLEKHQDLMLKLSESDKEAYIEEFEDRDAYLQNFKKTIENYFTSKKKTESIHSQNRQI